jgi:FkbM family methyltransferase
VNIEPDPDLFNMIQKERKEDTNLNVAIDAKEGEVDFFLFEEHTMNTINKLEAEKNIHERNFHFRKSVKIKALTLTSVIETHFRGRYPEFLSIDAEGTDETIVKSLDPSRVLPRVICIETVSYSPNLTGTKNPVIFSILKEKGYRVFADTYVNTIFVRGN